MESVREVEQAEALAFAELVPEIILVLETSAKDNKNVEEAFVELAAELKVFNILFIDFIFNNVENSISREELEFRVSPSMATRKLFSSVARQSIQRKNVMDVSHKGPGKILQSS